MDALRRLLAQFRTYWQGLGRPRRVGLIVVTALILLSLGLVIYFAPGTQYRPVYSDLAPDEAGAMTTKLTAANIPNRLANGGSAVEVPEDRLAQARVALAQEGLPARGGKGYELFDESSLTMTPFVQTVNYQRALQAELSRSITQIEAVQSARVLIARPEPSPFIRDQRPPTASVVLKLKPGAKLSRESSAGIVSLVARSVEGLKPENVTVMDSAGRLLSDPHAAEHDDLPEPQLEYRRELENYLAAKAEDMLSRHLGAGRAIVKVSADINFQKLKERRETYSPDGKVAAAERLTTNKTTGGSSSRGVAGAASNVSRAGASTSSGGSSSGGSSEEVIQTDYLVSRTVQDVEDRMGAVTRLTVAVMADLTAPADGGAIISVEDAQEIIKQAVGFRSGRDEIKFTNAKLQMPAAPPEGDEELAQLQRVQTYVVLGRNVCLALAVVLSLTVIPLTLLRRRRQALPAPSTAAAPTQPARQIQVDRLAEMIRSDPERVAKVFGMMIGKPAA